MSNVVQRPQLKEKYDNYINGKWVAPSTGQYFEVLSPVDNKPIELWSNEVIQQKIDYIHNNPVEEGIVFRPEDYKYSSAVDYSGERGILEDICIFQFFKL